jgi:hypothetical protein
LIEYRAKRNRVTVFLDTVLQPGSLNICVIMGYISREHIHLPMVLDVYYRYVCFQGDRQPTKV